MAACAYVLDNKNNVLLTRRPSSLRDFPQAWVVPGGHVDFGETFEEACLREVMEEVGLCAESWNGNSAVFAGDINALFEPYYLYESVTKNIHEIDDHQNEKFPPKSQHLCLFYLIKLSSHYTQIPLLFNADEVEEAAWVSMDALRDTLFHQKYSHVPGYRIRDTSQFDVTNCLIDTQAFYPLYRYNPLRQGLGKGHYLALKYLL